MTDLSYFILKQGALSHLMLFQFWFNIGRYIKLMLNLQGTKRAVTKEILKQFVGTVSSKEVFKGIFTFSLKIS